MVVKDSSDALQFKCQGVLDQRLPRAHKRQLSIQQAQNLKPREWLAPEPRTSVIGDSGGKAATFNPSESDGSS